MGRKILTALGILVGLLITGLLVAASIWPVINEVETGKTPQYPDVLPQYYTAEPARVFEEARDGVKAMERWEVVGADTSTYTLKATHATRVFGFVDDVTVWVEPVTEFVTRVRVRSASRVGEGDFGQNARNIRMFFEELDQRLGAVKFDPDKLEEGGVPTDRENDEGKEKEEAESDSAAP